MSCNEEDLTGTSRFQRSVNSVSQEINWNKSTWIVVYVDFFGQVTCVFACYL